jgi:hypothetical protein
MIGKAFDLNGDARETKFEDVTSSDKEKKKNWLLI